MRKLTLLLCAVFLLLISCKKDAVDSTNLKTFQSSINDMASSLNTLQQYKFNEALYILKTFAVDAEGETHELVQLSKLLEGKKVPDIFRMADEVARENGIDWTSTGPPSLGEMNIFEDVTAKESDANDISASALRITTRPTQSDSILGPKALVVVPRLVDGNGKNIEFSGAALETVMEVFSGGNKVYTSKNLMQDNKFYGFTLRFDKLPAEKLQNNSIDITVSVKTSSKTLKMTNVGVKVNPNALLQPQVAVPADPGDTELTDPSLTDPLAQPAPGNTPVASGDPKTTVQRFLNGISTQNLRSAYEASNNPAWGTYEKFSNPTTGFGSVKSVNVKDITTSASNPNSASVSASYDVTDKNGSTSSLNVTFGLKNVNGEWKISSYKIN
ncbi:hypothetical protein P0M11_04405 [Kaistella sp. PBT33-4]|uniref:hypothetical protein n=1 Tax=Kaistella sp. PBT33-4 TaxID=3032000 RepID=UPI0023D87EEE|nr:hypothetical protein [Kaistella sp. PBT33-4]MDF0719235.1 hypothetical protein [Kaistella sp. PBT33-4]